MKIGILTQPLHANYGGLLQNYALQQTLIRAGYEVETIDWNTANSIKDTLYKMKMNFLYFINPTNYPKPRYQPTGKEKSIMWRNTNHFINSYIQHTSPVVCFSEFKRQAYVGKYGAYVVGSDQCWRPRYNFFLSAMFLDFVSDSNNIKRIAYAASFGTDEWEFAPEQTALCRPLAQKFNLITVREDIGVKLCKENFGVNATHVLDPTLLLVKQDYINLIEAEKEPKSKGNLFSYILDPDDAKCSFIKKTADSMGLTPFQVLPKYQAENRTREDIKKRIEDCVFPNVTKWLRAFMDAEMTIVDSFHGMVFSIIFNKPFWVIGNKDRGLSRFTSLLKCLCLEDRMINVKDLGKVDINKPIDWGRINMVLQKKREESKDLLLNMLK